MNNIISTTTDIQSADEARSAGIPVVTAAEARPLMTGAGKKKRVRRSGSAMRIIGNLFIAVGLLTLLGIGGYYGYSEWSNQQFKQKLVQSFGANSFDPPVASTLATATPTNVPPAVVVDLSGGINKIGVFANKQPVEVDSSPPVRLYLPAVGIDSKIVPVGWNMIPSPGGGTKAEWQVADYAVGHHKGSPNPGQPGNVVMSGHVDYKGEVFRDLNKSQKGDEVIVYTEKGQYMYVITDMVIVLEDGATQEQKRRNARYMDPTPDQTLTMITCWPYGIDNYRLIVIAKPYQSSLTAQSEFRIR